MLLCSVSSADLLLAVMEAVPCMSQQCITEGKREGSGMTQLKTSGYNVY